MFLVLPYFKRRIIPLVIVLSGLVYIKRSDLWNPEQFSFHFTRVAVWFLAFFLMAIYPHVSFSIRILMSSPRKSSRFMTRARQRYI